MDSSIQPVDPKPVGEVVPPPALLAGEPFDRTTDPYADAELALRHARIERMIEKAREKE